MSWQVIEADCVEAMREMDEASVDAIVTDPPYGLEFMGKEWDRLGAGTETANEGADVSHPFRDGTQRVRFGASVKAMQAWHQAWATEALRVLKPGGHLLAFGGTRTYHRLACAVEDAGFEIRDSVIWLYGSGFPKSLDVSKAIDRAAGAERVVVGQRVYADGTEGSWRKASSDKYAQDEWTTDDGDRPKVDTAPATPEAQRWQGWGTALKPAHEPIVVARKPLIGTVAQNVSEFGTGALNIDGCRIGLGDEQVTRDFSKQKSTTGEQTYGDFPNRPTDGIWENTTGRWPANVALSHLSECEDEACAESCAVAELDRQSGERPTPGNYERATAGEDAFEHKYSGGKPRPEIQAGYGDTGGASRFFATFGGDPETARDLTANQEGACRSAGSNPAPSAAGALGDSPRFLYTAKASRAERNAGLEGFEEREVVLGHNAAAVPAAHGQTGKPNSPIQSRNHHPTVKPIDLMRWLCRLVTPPEGTILDPFAGSGTTGIAAVLEGFDFIGIERESEYVEISRARIAWWDTHKDRAEEILALSSKSERERAEHEAAGQMGLLDG